MAFSLLWELLNFTCMNEIHILIILYTWWCVHLAGQDCVDFLFQHLSFPYKWALLVAEGGAFLKGYQLPNRFLSLFLRTCTWDWYKFLAREKLIQWLNYLLSCQFVYILDMVIWKNDDLSNIIIFVNFCNSGYSWFG